MVRTIQVSKDGLSRCPGCQTHIRVAQKLEETICPFCQTPLLRPPGARSGGLRGRGAKVAMTLFGAAALLGVGAACHVAPVYGAPPQEKGIEQPAPNDAGANDSGNVQVEKAPETGPVQKYGIPPIPDR